jgi:hypothetical protein
MLKNFKDPKETRDAMLSLLPTSGTLAGIAVALAGLLVNRAKGASSTIADELLLIAALGFLAVCYLIFFAIRNVESSSARLMMQFIDTLFLVSLTLIVFSGFVIAYEFI